MHRATLFRLRLSAAIFIASSRNIQTNVILHLHDHKPSIIQQTRVDSITIIYCDVEREREREREREINGHTTKAATSTTNLQQFMSAETKCPAVEGRYV